MITFKMDNLKLKKKNFKIKLKHQKFPQNSLSLTNVIHGFVVLTDMRCS